MGNSESQQQDAGDTGARQRLAASPEMRTCYYEILDVERSDTTTTDDIKKVRYTHRHPPSLSPVPIEDCPPLNSRTHLKNSAPLERLVVLSLLLMLTPGLSPAGPEISS